MLFRVSSICRLFVAGLSVFLLAPSILAQPGKKGGGSDGETPTLRLPPLDYEVDVIPVPGMGEYFDTNDYGVSVVSMRPDWDPHAPADLRNSHRKAVAAVVFPTVDTDGSLDSQVVYLDQEIDPKLENIDLDIAAKINNQGQILCLGRVYDADGIAITHQGFLLTPKTVEQAEIDGFSYDIEPLYLPFWAERVSNATAMHLSDSTCDSTGKLRRPNLVYRVRSAIDESNSSTYTAIVVHYADGFISEPDLTTTTLPSSINAFNLRMNASGTMLVSQFVDGKGYSDYLLNRDGTRVWPQNLSGSDGWNQIDDLGNHGYSCGTQLRIVGYKKVRGGQEAIYALSLTYHTPTGASYELPLRSGTVLSSGELIQISDQIINQVPVVANAHMLFYPTYDFAYLRELMSPTEQLEYDGLRFGHIYDLNRTSERRSIMTSPRTENGVDHQGAPSFYQGAYYRAYPDGTGGFEGIYVIHGTRKSTP